MNRLYDLVDKEANSPSDDNRKLIMKYLDSMDDNDAHYNTLHHLMTTYKKIDDDILAFIFLLLKNSGDVYLDVIKDTRRNHPFLRYHLKNYLIDTVKTEYAREVASQL